MVTTEQYVASKFPGGEIQIEFKPEFFHSLHQAETVIIDVRINNSDKIMLLGLAADTIKRFFKDIKIVARIIYMPYQQSDREFKIQECIGLRTVSKILRTFPIDKFSVYDPHSDSTGNLLDPESEGRSSIASNAVFIKNIVLSRIRVANVSNNKDLTILSPDAGAYKKVFKLCEDIKFDGVIESANKFRDAEGKLRIHTSCKNFGGRNILVVDDICLGGRTFTELYDSIKASNIGNAYLAISHGIFNNGFSDLLSRYNMIFTTNSWQSEEQIRSQLEKEGCEQTRLVVHDIF